MSKKPKAKRGCIGRIIQLVLWAVGILFALVVAVAVFGKPPNPPASQLAPQSLQSQTQPATPTPLVPTATPLATNTIEPATATTSPTQTPLPTEALAPAQPIAIAQGNNSSAFTCIGGCAEAPDPTCNIKGNVNSKKEKIYHVEGWQDYDRVDIKPAEGDRWFCTEQEAIDAGFRAPKNH